MKAINELLSIMKTLRDPEKGCAWDRQQTIASIAPYTLEEAYEVIDSIENGDMDGLCSELGDLLFHIVFYAEMANEAGAFDFKTVVERVCTKLRHRHPHVFAGKQIHNEEQLSGSWEAIKKQEREKKAKESGNKAGLLDDISTVLPAMIRAEKLQNRAATVGFDWQDSEPVLNKVAEELAELEQEIKVAAEATRLTEELGDLLFSCVNLARHLKINSETALRLSNHKFAARFHYIEVELNRQGLTMEQASLEQMESLWQAAKQA
jgi:ATP diphosphatase